MAALSESEVRPGLVAFLDGSVLASREGVLANTRVVPDRQRSATDFRPFLVVEQDEDGRCLCVPLFSREGPWRVALDQEAKTGPGRSWTGRPSYYSVFQFWIVPVEALVAASGREVTRVGARLRYAEGTPDLLDGIASHRHDSENEFHPVDPRHPDHREMPGMQASRP